jgi:hypothetical protein
VTKKEELIQELKLIIDDPEKLERFIIENSNSNPEYGFSFMEKWIGKDKVIDDIIKSNLRKNRLLKKYPKKTEELLKGI